MDFIIRPYTKKELALMYFPESEPSTARRHLNRWMRQCKPLWNELQQTGYQAQSKTFTARQTELIEHYLGSP
jgi:hypothetical protein